MKFWLVAFGMFTARLAYFPPPLFSPNFSQPAGAWSSLLSVIHPTRACLGRPSWSPCWGMTGESGLPQEWNYISFLKIHCSPGRSNGRYFLFFFFFFLPATVSWTLLTLVASYGMGTALATSWSSTGGRCWSRWQKIVMMDSEHGTKNHRSDRLSLRKEETHMPEAETTFIFWSCQQFPLPCKNTSNCN